MTSKRIPKRQLKALWEYFRAQPDFRKRRGRRHTLASVLLIVLVARVAGRDTATKMARWARCLSQPQLRRLGARRNPRTGRFEAPSLNTIRRVLAEIDIEQLERDVDAWLQAQGNAREPCEPLGMDGKCLKGSYDHDRQDDGTRADKGPQYQLSVVGIDTGQVYAQQGYSALKKAAEGDVARLVLGRLGVAGHCILADALHTQVKTAALILELGGDYVFVVKGNQPKLHAQLQAIDWDALEGTTQTGLNRERIETRTIHVAEELPAGVDFPGARVAARLVRSSEDKSGEDKRGPETVYLITSLRPQQCRGELLIDLTRGYWAATENGCHRVRDHNRAEDKCRARKGNLPRSLALFANLAISMLRMVGTGNIAEAMELNCYQPNQALALATP